MHCTGLAGLDGRASTATSNATAAQTILAAVVVRSTLPTDAVTVKVVAPTWLRKRQMTRTIMTGSAWGSDRINTILIGCVCVCVYRVCVCVCVRACVRPFVRARERVVATRGHSVVFTILACIIIMFFLLLRVEIEGARVVCVFLCVRARVLG